MSIERLRREAVEVLEKLAEKMQVCVKTVQGSKLRPHLLGLTVAV